MITGQTKVFALIGNPVSHSLSPVIHNTALKELGIDGVYIALATQEHDLEVALKGLWTLGIQGVNVTVPYKEKVLPFLERITPQAQLIGAVNTLVRGEKGFVGDNTDGQGLAMALKREGFSPGGKKIVVLGAGGSARAVAITLALMGAQAITLVNRTLEKASQIAQIIKENTQTHTEVLSWEDKTLGSFVGEAQIVINTTTLGMAPANSKMPPIDPNWLEAGQLVVDLIYSPLETQLLKKAQGRGCSTANGLGMLAYQGALAFSLWTGKEPPFEIMLEELTRKVTR